MEIVELNAGNYALRRGTSFNGYEYKDLDENEPRWWTAKSNILKYCTTKDLYKLREVRNSEASLENVKVVSEETLANVTKPLSKFETILGFFKFSSIRFKL